MPEGRVIEGVGGFYKVMDLGSGESLQALARSKFKYARAREREDEHGRASVSANTNSRVSVSASKRVRDGVILVGDIVTYEFLPEGQIVIEEIHPRKSELLRPTVSNIDRIAVVFALKDPDYNRILIDRFLLLAETTGLEVLLIFNKQDLVTKAKVREAAEPYTRIGYKTIATSTKTREGKGLLLREIRSGVTVFSGPSGVGKSALINMVNPKFFQETGEVSKKIGRGRHTTRQAKFLPLPKQPGFIVDTPGFTQVDLDFIAPEQLGGFFPDFLPWMGKCRFPGCLHKQEPECAVKERVKQGEIFPWRYQNYLTFLQEIERFKQARAEQKYRGHKRS